MRITIISTCTGSKAYKPVNQLTMDDFMAGEERIAARSIELAPYRLPAAAMYTGEQHVRLMRGVESARAAGHEVDVWIASAGYGLLAEQEPIVPYEATFIGMPKAAKKRWAEQLHLAEDIRRILSKPHNLALILLSDAYLEVAGLRGFEPPSFQVWALCGSASVHRLAGGIRLLPLVQSDTSRFNCGMVGLKGAVAALALRAPNPLEELQRQAARAG